MYRLKQLTLAMGDIALFWISLVTSVAIRSPDSFTNTFITLAPHFCLVGFFVSLIAFVVGLYDISLLRGMVLVRKIFLAIIGGCFVGMGYFYLFSATAGVAPKTILLLTMLIAGITTGMWRIFFERFIVKNFNQRSVVCLGNDAEMDTLVTHLATHPLLGYTVVKHYRVFDPAKLETELDSLHPNIVVISPISPQNIDTVSAWYPLIMQKYTTRTLSAMYEEILRRIPRGTLSEGWVISHLNEPRSAMYDRLRIIFDYLSASVLGILFLFLLPWVALAIRLDSRGPIFFRQQRVGRNNQPFTLYKFRSMKALAADGSAETNGPQFTSTNDDRITRVGRIVRKFRIDELPQIINVFKGEMGLIGPRPERPAFAAELTAVIPYYPLRHLVKPGFTGWAQVQNAYYGTIDENLLKLEYDLYYIKHRGPLLDLAIVLRTIGIVMGMKGR